MKCKEYINSHYAKENYVVQYFQKHLNSSNAFHSQNNLKKIKIKCTFSLGVD